MHMGSGTMCNYTIVPVSRQKNVTKEPSRCYIVTSPSSFQLLQYVIKNVLVALQLQTAVGIGKQGVGARVVEQVEGTLGIDVEAFG